MNIIQKKLKKKLNLKFSFLDEFFKIQSFNLLDVGAGNHSASRTKEVFSNCNYYGLDICKKYENNDSDFAMMNDFYEIDLMALDYSTIPDNFFDAIIMAHVIEHLDNGDLVVPLLLQKLKVGGVFYIEYPGKRSL
ncbi:MAG: class I SAM-dependent methyltransferase, partial [Bacteroidales bacterium]|nr:class I SAM-dependent methyltransferase [Bacteroidales bacterium]